MRAVNLIPAEGRGRRSGAERVAGAAPGGFGPGGVLVALLGVVALFVLVLVITDNTVASRKATLAQVQSSVAQEQALAQRLSVYTDFQNTTEQRISAVREIAAGRFNWDAALKQLSQVVPGNTSFQALAGTTAASSTTAVTGTTGANTAVPTFQITGCTTTQDDVAGLMNRLRLIDGVTAVTLSSSQKGNSATAATSAKSVEPRGCLANAPLFNLGVTFAPLATAPVPALGSAG